MNKEEVLKMEKKQIKYQMDELERLRDLDMIEEYKQFKNIFLDSISQMYCLNVDKEFSDLITNFIIKEINNFNEKSNYIMENKRISITGDKYDKNGILSMEYSKKYKYCQQIMYDYMKIIRYQNNNLKKYLDNYNPINQVF